MYCKCGMECQGNHDVCQDCQRFLSEERQRWEEELNQKQKIVTSQESKHDKK
jgi:hypothetical protein